MHTISDNKFTPALPVLRAASLLSTLRTYEPRLSRDLRVYTQSRALVLLARIHNSTWPSADRHSVHLSCVLTMYTATHPHGCPRSPSHH